jgi:outer membrane protein W
VFADMGRITNNIMLEPRMDYWSKSEGAFGAEASIRDLSVGARAKYLFETSNPKIQPFAGVGLGMHFLKAEVTVPGFRHVDV